MPRRTAPSDSPALRARLAAALDLTPTEAEAEAGYDTPASLILDVGRREPGRWVVVLHRGGKHVVPDAEVPASAPAGETGGTSG